MQYYTNLKLHVKFEVLHKVYEHTYGANLKQSIFIDQESTVVTVSEI